jgi:hypothetical protein
MSANATGAWRYSPAPPEPGWVTRPGPDSTAWAWVPAAAVLFGVAVPLACCVGAVLCGAAAGDRRRRGGGDEEDPSVGAGPRRPPREVVAVIHPDGGVGTAEREG